MLHCAPGKARRPAGWISRQGRTRWLSLLVVLSLVATPTRHGYADEEREPPPPAFHWLDRVNAVRAAADLPPIAEEAAWSTGSRLHSRYMVKNDYLGHDEDEDNPWYTPEGRAAAQNGIAYTNDAYDASEQRGVDALLTTPFHLVNVLDPRLVNAGFGWYREQKGVYQAAATLDVMRGISPSVADPRQPIIFPGDGKTMPFSHYYGTEYPDPRTSCPGELLGAPIIVQLGTAPEDLSVRMTKAGQALEHCVVDETSYVHPDPDTEADGRAILGARHAVVIMPHAPLSAGTYEVALMHGSVTVAWSFHGPSATTPPRMTALAHTSGSLTQGAGPETVDQGGPAAACSPRPALGVGTTEMGRDGLLVTVAAQGDRNDLKELRFGSPARPFQNAFVSLPGHPAPIVGDFALTLPPGSPQRSFVVRRVMSGQAMLAPIAVADACGAWLVVVRGGPDDDLEIATRPNDGDRAR